MKIGIGRAVPPFRVMDVIAEANARAQRRQPGDARILRLEVGQPGTGLPLGARLAAEAALRTGATLGYTEALGMLPLRERIAAHIQDWYGTTIAPARIAVTFGASGAFPLAFLAAFDPGDTIALAAPYYPPYVNIATALGLKPLILPCGIETGFQPTVAMLEALERKPDGLIVASPANPTGSMLSPDELKALARYCHANGIRLISDEIYHGLTYGKPIASAAQFSESAIVINSFSKYFSMTGWRVGWMVCPEELVRPVERLAANFFVSPSYISQVAAQAAFACTQELEANRARYATARQMLLTGLETAGFTKISPPDGAFYLYADSSSRAADSGAFCARLLDEADIAVTPGYDFDAQRGKNFFRMSYCAALPDIEEAIFRLCRLKP
ncbi:aminotransferase [Acidocella aquatica]|uniref:Aminotransferase n=1 Tax=Acidocella aquatica TaxID=1922313 RepID=A0ABQ6A8D5_9PROT|nr:aminotransferase class I/II-fold pyridoxal phosphate-dependent enzyme [Acidocella aquatica]GLR68479.1 aminotransferase [Acidocella aquatica]